MAGNAGFRMRRTLQIVDPDTSGKFKEPAKCGCWAAIAFVSENESRFSEAKFRNYVDAFVHRCQARGIQIEWPTVQKYLFGATNLDMVHEFYAAKGYGVQFIHFVISDELQFNAQIKILDWRERILTQVTRTKTATLILEQPKAGDKGDKALNLLTSNVNEKLGGISLELPLEELADRFLTERTLIVGIDHWNPNPNSKWSWPSVVGYTSDACRRLNFNGGCLCGWIEKEHAKKDGVIYGLMLDCIKKFSAKRSGYPNHVLIFCQGMRQNQLSHAVNQIDQASVDTLGSARHPRLTFVACVRTKEPQYFKKPYHISRTDFGKSPFDELSEWLATPYRSFEELDAMYFIVHDSANIDNRGLRSIVRSLTRSKADGASVLPLIFASGVAKGGCINFRAAYPGDTNEPKFSSMSKLNTYLGFIHDGEPT